MREASKEFFSELRRYNYVTPTSYLELISTFRALLDVKRAEVSQAKRRYDVGLQKLSETMDAKENQQLGHQPQIRQSRILHQDMTTFVKKQ